MKKRFARIIAVMLCAVTILVMTPVAVLASEGYTYNYDWWGDVQYSPDAYSVVGVYTLSSFGLNEKLNKPQGLFVSGDRIYICDSGNNRIIEIKRTSGTKFELVRIIDEFKGAENNTFNYPTDLAVSEDGNIFIADQNNGRVLKLDKDLNLLLTFTKPTDATFDQSLDFLPAKITVDTAERVYCVATNVNKGLIKYEPDAVFSGFVGAAKVTYDWADYIWKKFATKAQRAQMESFVPTEYDNVYMDYEGFIYVCTTKASEADIKSGKTDVVRRLNLMGNDILIRNGNLKIIGDVEWDNAGGYNGPSMITDITALDNDTYVLLDRVRGRLFSYDDQGNLLYAFGGNGNIDGCFRQPVAIDHMGHDLIVLDSLDSSITVFTPTEYGNDIYDAIELFKAGKYDESGAAWREVLDQNGNYDRAYIGIGRALIGDKNYKEALPYFKLKWDDDNYSKAFKQYRKQWVEEHIVVIFIVFFAILIIPIAVGRVKRIKYEIDTSEAFRFDNAQKINKKKKQEG